MSSVLRDAPEEGLQRRAALEAPHKREGSTKGPPKRAPLGGAWVSNRCSTPPPPPRRSVGHVPWHARRTSRGPLAKASIGAHSPAGSARGLAARWGVCCGEDQCSITAQTGDPKGHSHTLPERRPLRTRTRVSGARPACQPCSGAVSVWVTQGWWGIGGLLVVLRCGAGPIIHKMIHAHPPARPHRRKHTHTRTDARARTTAQTRAHAHRHRRTRTHTRTDARTRAPAQTHAHAHTTRSKTAKDKRCNQHTPSRAAFVLW